MKKRLLLVLLALTLIFGLTSCGGIGDLLGGLIGADEESSSADNGADGVDSSVESDTEAPQRDIVLFGGDNDYRIVYSDAANNNVKALLTEMTAKVKDTVGSKPAYATDTSKANTEIPQEILLGVTKRGASDISLGKISGFGYDVRFIGEKLVITASNDELLGKAVNDLYEAWTVSGGKIILSNKTVLTYDATDSFRPLFGEDGTEVKIIVPLKSTDELYDSAVYLSNSLSPILGTYVEIFYDEKTETTSDAYEICIGKTNRDISRTLYDNIDSIFGYDVITMDNRLAVGAIQDSVISIAVHELFSDLYNEMKYAYSGTPIISRDYTLTGIVSEVASELPMLEAGDFYGIYQSADDKFIIYTDNVTEADYSAYVAAIINDGAELLQEYSFGNNKYSLLAGDKYSAYVTYLYTENAIRTYVGPADTVYPLEDNVIEASVCEPAMWQLDVDNKGSAASGGMSYVIKLTDGSFVIIDGGYNTNTEADNLYNLLKSNTPEGEIPVISGWFITHLHMDHYGGLVAFANKYASLTEVKAFYYNFPGISVSSTSNGVDPSAGRSVEISMKKWKDAVRYDTLHSGMAIGFAGALAEIICTHEDVYPLTFADGNDTCTVVKFTIGGQSVLFLGDARYNQSATMVNTIPAQTLKSDIVQVSHHGYEGCSAALYKIVDASVALWPMNIVGYDSGKTTAIFKQWYNNNLDANKYIRECETIVKIIVSGAGTQKLDLPYTPTGERLPDYEKIYNERLSNT